MPFIPSQSSSEQGTELLGRHPAIGVTLVAYLLFLGLTYILALIGFWSAWHREGIGTALLLFSSIFYFTMITLGAGAQARYRLPIMPALFFFAAGGFLTWSSRNRMNPATAKPLRFIHLITSLGGGGTENFLFQILSRSPEQYQHRVFYLGYDGVNGNRIRHLGIPVERTSPWQFYRTLRREKPDVLHTCLHWAHQVGRIAGRIAKVPFILSSHRSIDVWQRPWDRDLDRRTLPLCTAVAVNSDAAQRVLEERLKTAKRRPRIVKVENGLDFDALKNWNRREARQNFGIPDGAVVGGTLMRLHPEKGAEKIPAFAKALLERYPQLILMIAGTGPLDRQLKEETKVWGDRVRWVGWQEDPVEFLSSLDFFWLLSREESFPQALLEASGVGLPWVAPDVGGVRNFRDAGACGFIYSPQDPNGAVTSIGGIIANLAAYEAKARQAVPQLKTRFDLARMVTAFYNIVGSRGR